MTFLGTTRARCCATGSIEQQDRMGALGDGAGDPVEVKLHGIRIGERECQRGACATGRTDRAVRALIALVGGLALPRCWRPAPGDADEN